MLFIAGKIGLDLAADSQNGPLASRQLLASHNHAFQLHNIDAT